MKKNRGFGKFIPEGTPTVSFWFPRILVLLCVGHLKEKEIWFLRIEKKKYICTWYYHWKWSGSPLKFKNQNLHDLFLESLFWINLCPPQIIIIIIIQTANIWLSSTEYVISAGLLWLISNYIGGVSKYAKISASMGKKWNLKCEIVASTFNIAVA